jgi:hypothetical protein
MVASDRPREITRVATHENGRENSGGGSAARTDRIGHEIALALSRGTSYIRVQLPVRMNEGLRVIPLRRCVNPICSTAAAMSNSAARRVAASIDHVNHHRHLTRLRAFDH